MVVKRSRAHTPRRRAFPDAAVSDTMGSVLLIALTVVVTASFTGFIMATKPGPMDTRNTDLLVGLDDGAGGWGTGDERVIVTHAGGEAVPASRALIAFHVGGTAFTCQGVLLGGPFDDGVFSIGEEWDSGQACLGSLFIPTRTRVNVEIVETGDDPQIIGSGSLLSSGLDCTVDTTAPVAAAWLQGPADLSAGSTGDVTVTVTLTDDCSGVDPAVAPRLYYRINDGTDPAYTDGGAMADAGTHRYTATIPRSLPWLSDLGRTLEYYAGPVQDTMGNPGDTAVRSDLIDLVGTTTFVGSNTDGPGATALFSRSRSMTDGKASYLNETNTAGGTTTASYSATSTVSSSGWTNPANGYTSNNLYATTTGDGNVLRYGLSDPPSPPTATILSVVLKMEGMVCRPGPTLCTSIPDDGFELRGCIGASPCSSYSSPLVVATLVDGTVQYNITSLRSPGAWTWNDINALEAYVRTAKSASVDGTWRVDHAFVEVKHRPTASHQMAIRYEFSNVPVGPAQVLDINYWVVPSTDAFNVQVCQDAATPCLAWVTRGTPLSATTATAWNYVLSTAEYNAGSPRIRFVDASAGGAVMGQLRLGHVRVVTT